MQRIKGTILNYSLGEMIRAFFLLEINAIELKSGK